MDQQTKPNPRTVTDSSIYSEFRHPQEVLSWKRGDSVPALPGRRLEVMQRRGVIQQANGYIRQKCSKVCPLDEVSPVGDSGNRPSCGYPVIPEE